MRGQDFTTRLRKPDLKRNLIELDKVIHEITELHKELNTERKAIEKRIMEDYNKLLTLKVRCGSLQNYTKIYK
jgi:hypothetical protein